MYYVDIGKSGQCHTSGRYVCIGTFDNRRAKRFAIIGTIPLFRPLPIPGDRKHKTCDRNPRIAPFVTKSSPSARNLDPGIVAVCCRPPIGGKCKLVLHRRIITYNTSELAREKYSIGTGRSDRGPYSGIESLTEACRITLTVVRDPGVQESISPRWLL